MDNTFHKALKDLLGEDTIKRVKELKTKFFPVSMKEAKLKDGTIITYQGDTPQQGMEVYAVTEQGTLPLADGEFVMEDGTTLIVAEGKITEVKPPQAQQKPADQQPVMTTDPGKPQPKKTVETKVKESVFRKKQPDTKFFTYLKGEYLSEKFNPADYPWEECISEQAANDVECPECVCAAIKNRTVSHLIQSKQAKDVYEAVAMIEERFTADPVYAYLYKEAIKKDVAEQTIRSLTSRLDEQTKEYEKMRTEMASVSELNKEMFGIISKIADMPSEKPRVKAKDGVTKPEKKEQFTEDFQKDIARIRNIAYAQETN